MRVSVIAGFGFTKSIRTKIEKTMLDIRSTYPINDECLPTAQLKIKKSAIGCQTNGKLNAIM